VPPPQQEAELNDLRALPVTEDPNMRLKKLIVQGFKSFADRTEFVFDSPITGIVGPNGCGKSNVVDAFKWVLGEQSAKSLRGEAMLDVIFNGSAARKLSNMAEVTLVFENPRRDDQTRLLNIDSDEVAVGRCLYRDGTSEYQLNNQPSRLRDIRDLFLDTGVGVDAYSVIEQGKVDLLLQANPQERRLIFEEAAGISKYKLKKKETLRKLEKVDQNLLRVTDIVEEVEKRLRSVKIQAGRARTFQEHSQRLRELRLGYALREYHVQSGQLSGLQTARDEAQFRLDDAAGDLSRRQAELGERREELEAATQRRQQVEYGLVQARASLQSSRQKQQYARQQMEQIAEQRSTLEHDRGSLEDKLQEVTESLERETGVLAQLTEALNEQRIAIESTQESFKEGQQQLNELSHEVEQRKAAILDLMRRLAGVNNRLGAIDIERRNIAAQRARVDERRAVVASEMQQLEGRSQEIAAAIEETMQRIAAQQAQLDTRRADAQSLNRQLAQLAEELGDAREARSGLLSRQKLLQDLEQRREGMSEGVKTVLKQREQRFPFIRGVVADALRVDVEHAAVIETALDGRDQWLVAADSQAVLAGASELSKLDGRVNVICLDRVAAPAPGRDWDLSGHAFRYACDLVEYSAEDAPLAQHLLGSTLIVEALADALALHAAVPRGYRFVTRSGEVLESDGVLRAGKLKAATGILSRRSELTALAQQISEVDTTVERLQKQISEGNTQTKDLEAQINTLRNELYQSNTARVELSSQATQVADRRAALNREQPVLDRELEIFEQQSVKLESEEQSLQGQSAELEAKQAEHHQQIEASSEKLQVLAEDLRRLAEQLTGARVALGQIQEKQLASQQQVQRQGASRSEITQQLERLARLAETLSSRQAEVENELAEAQESEERLKEEEQTLTRQIEEAAERVSTAHAGVQALSAEVEKIRKAHAEVEKTLHELELQLGEIKVRMESLVARTFEELELDLPARYKELCAAEGGYSPAEQDWDAVADEIKTLRDKIQRLGNVNLDAIGEQDELESREKFLAEQVADLTNSKKQMEGLIDEINRESSLRFEQTFNAVREHFQGMFRKLFGGGKADIYLETELEQPAGQIGPDGQPLPAPAVRKIDALDAGIEIIAKPPGKQPCSISQLSGGEKTMTCVALLMSIFKSKPSPFCILDEVDAALDEANNQRFNLIVQEFLQQSQFIIITHSKRTMQIADQLYGVTMQEQGVSKRVAVKFDQVDNNGRITDAAA
jgi:chromosome segregation protein